ncbi:hypothetical protein FRC06_006962 [Ceratobasidium sp. 370]|nr:hypothetical protein FRC06_006962 [Ceratobasidium sp. 370]
MSYHFHAQLLAYLATKLYLVVPNLMAEERTVSCFMKLNTRDHSCQKTDTLVFMTQIKQHEQRIENLRTGTTTDGLTVWFRDLSDLVQLTTVANQSGGLHGVTCIVLHTRLVMPQNDTEVEIESVGTQDRNESDLWDERDEDELNDIVLGE